MTELHLAGYKLTFQDEFEDFYAYDGQWGWQTTYWGERTIATNEELQIYMDAEYKGAASYSLGVNPFSVNDGVLAITAQPTPDEISAFVEDMPYTSGMITTANAFSQLYGYFEIRMQVPEGQGLWPAFWLMPANGEWPPEIDVVEVMGNDTGTIHQTGHQYDKQRYKFEYLNQVDAAAGFNTYGVLWTERSITWYVNGVETFTSANVYDQPMYLLANLAVGGVFPGNPDETTQFPAELKIDYIRAYSSDPDAPDPQGPSEPIIVGEGQNSIVVRVSQDHYLADAMFRVLVDGVQLGPDVAVTARNLEGNWQNMTFKTDLATDVGTVSVMFLNDALGGGWPDDRNLYVHAVFVDGVEVSNAKQVLYTNGALNFTVPAGTVKMADPVVRATPEEAVAESAVEPVTVGTGENSILIRVSEDAYLGNAKFRVLVDGTQIGPLMTAAASQAAGEWQEFDMRIDLPDGAGMVEVEFLNDKWDGSPSQDRNLYVHSIAVDGTAVMSGTRLLNTNKVLSYALPLQTVEAAPQALAPSFTEGTTAGPAYVEPASFNLPGNAGWSKSIKGTSKDDAVLDKASGDVPVGDLVDDTNIADSARDVVVKVLDDGTNTVPRKINECKLPQGVEDLTFPTMVAVPDIGNDPSNRIIGNDTLISRYGIDISIDGERNDIFSYRNLTDAGGTVTDFLRGVDVIDHRELVSSLRGCPIEGI